MARSSLLIGWRIPGRHAPRRAIKRQGALPLTPKARVETAGRETAIAGDDDARVSHGYGLSLLDATDTVLDDLRASLPANVDMKSASEFCPTLTDQDKFSPARSAPKNRSTRVMRSSFASVALAPACVD